MTKACTCTAEERELLDLLHHSYVPKKDSTHEEAVIRFVYEMCITANGHAIAKSFHDAMKSGPPEDD